MMALLLSVTLGLGVWLLYEGLTNPTSSEEKAQRRSERLQRMEDFLTRAGLHEVSPRDFVLFALVSGALAFVATQLLLGWVLVSLMAAALGVLAPVAYYVRRHDRRRAAMQSALVDAIGQLRDSIRTGLSVQEALSALARNGPTILRPEFARLVREARFDGFEVAIGGMQRRMADPVFDTVASTLRLNERLGGRNVSQVLDRLAQATRSQRRVQDELRASQAHNILSAQIVAAVPLVLLMVIRGVNPGYLAMFNTLVGQTLLAGTVVSVAFGYAAMLWMTRLPGEVRVLR